MYVNVDALEAKVKPQLKLVEKYLNLSYESLASINVPGDFPYPSKVLAMPRTVIDIRNRIKLISRWLDIQINNLINAEHNNKGLVDGLGVMNLVFSMDGQPYRYGGDGPIIPDPVIMVDMMKKLGKDIMTFTGASGEIYVYGLDGNVKVLEPQNQVGLIDAHYVQSQLGAAITDLVLQTGASVANSVFAIVKGVGDAAEGLVDAVIVVGGSAVSLVALIPGGLEAASVLEGTMAIVSYDAVGNVYKEFYENTNAGQWLDENAYAPFKSDGVATGALTQIGYYAPVVIMSGLSGGTLASVFAGIAAFGNEAEDNWAKAKTEYEKELQALYESGKITKEEMEIMKEDWATGETYLKGLISAGASAGYEALSFGKFAGKNWITSGIVSSGQTPVNAFIDWVNEGGNPFEHFEDEGGLLSMFIDGVAGSLSYSAGELSNNASTNRINSTKDDLLREVQDEIDNSWKEIDDMLDEYNINVPGAKERIVDAINNSLEKPDHGNAIRGALNIEENRGRLSGEEKGQLFANLASLTDYIRSNEAFKSQIDNITIKTGLDGVALKSLISENGEYAAQILDIDGNLKRAVGAHDFTLISSNVGLKTLVGED